MRRKNICKILVLLLLLAGFANQSRTSAQNPTEPVLELPQTSQCGDQTLPSYTALLPIQESYDVFIKLGKTDQSAPASLFVQSFTDASCKQIGTVSADGKNWQKIGELLSGDKDLITLTLNTSAGEGLPSANRPTIMIVSKANPACAPTTECFVDINGRQGVLKGVSSLNNQDSLRVVKTQNLTGDSINNVDYFVDGRFAYKQKLLEDFNRRYVGGGEYKLTTVATYESKQQVVLTEVVTQSFANEINYIAFSFLEEHSLLLTLLAVATATWLVFSILLSVARAIYKHRVWKQNHILKQPSAPQTVSIEEPQELHIQAEESEIKWVAKSGGKFMIVVTGVIVALIIINSFFLQLFITDGPSMQVTLSTGDRLLTNKVGKAWSKLSGNEYIPKRGEVIVFQKKAQSDLFAAAAGEVETSYVVKRVFGLPGERVVVKDGKVKIYNTDKKDGFDPEAGQSWAKNLQISKDDNIDITLGTDELFVIGDNRPESIDSRANGSIKLDDVVGNAIMRIAPKPTIL